MLLRVTGGSSSGGGRHRRSSSSSSGRGAYSSPASSQLRTGAGRCAARRGTQPAGRVWCVGALVAGGDARLAPTGGAAGDDTARGARGLWRAARLEMGRGGWSGGHRRSYHDRHIDLRYIDWLEEGPHTTDMMQLQMSCCWVKTF